jgi:hypothetical protein
MNKLVIASLVAALSGSTVAPQTASAHDHGNVAAAIGGFIGGLIVGSSVRDHDDVRVERRVIIRDDCDRPSGYWGWNEFRVWVPGQWSYGFDDCGRRYRYFERGHYEIRRERVWIETRGPGRYGRD